MERAVAARFEALITEALSQLTAVVPESSTFHHAGTTKRSLDAALLRAAARRRKLGVIALAEETQIIESGRSLLGFHQNMPATLTMIDRLVTNNKNLTKRILQNAGLPVANGRVVSTATEALDALHTLGGPVVVKPITGSNGIGITVGVAEESQFARAVDIGFAKGSRLLIEECLPSIDLRVTVVAGRAVAAMMRVPANIVGDGRSTVLELIKTKNTRRAANAFHRFVPIHVNQATEAHLLEQDLKLETVIEEGRRVFLHFKANLSSGGDSINVTDYIHPDFLRIAERAMACFHSARHAGVDILAEKLRQPASSQRYLICEVNCNNDLPIHVFPLFGKSIDVAAAEIDAYLPIPTRHVFTSGLRGSRARLRKHALWDRKRRRTYRKGTASRSEFVLPRAWQELTSALSEPLGRRQTDLPVSDTLRTLDAAFLTQSLSDLGLRNARAEGRLLLGQSGDEDVIIERSGKSVFSGVIASHPEMLHKLLAEVGIPTCVAMRYGTDELPVARTLFESTPGPWNLRIAGRKRAGRFSFLSSQVLEEGWSRLAARSTPLLLQQAADILSVRFLLLNGAVAASNLLVPPGIVGDGRSTVGEILEEKVRLRGAHPFLQHYPGRKSIYDERRIHHRELATSTVLTRGRWVTFGRSPLPEAGGETIGLATCPVPGLVDLARSTVRLVGDPPVASVTLVARPSLSRRHHPHWAVSELDADPVLSQFAWPWAGHTPGVDLYATVASIVCAGQHYRLRLSDTGEPGLSSSDGCDR
jgi:D-alanine-D-alanine ligase-like ATP-grasp enzyme